MQPPGHPGINLQQLRNPAAVFHLDIVIEGNAVNPGHPGSDILQLRDMLHQPQAPARLAARHRRQQSAVLIGQAINAVLKAFEKLHHHQIRERIHTGEYAVCFLKRYVRRDIAK
ncbi:hypothetical protein D3C87_1886890 [compost metagenome]